MNDEPNAQNHLNSHQRQEPDDQHFPLPDLEALTSRLTIDGAEWRSRLPDPAHVTDRIRAIADDTSPGAPSEGDILMFDDTGPGPERPHLDPRASHSKSLMRRLGAIAAVAVVAALVGSMTLVFYLVHGAHGTGAVNQHPASNPSVIPTVMSVTSVTMGVAPQSLQGVSCGSHQTVTYTATIHVTPNSGGGTVQFTYTVNNGRSATPASVTVAPGETTTTYTFAWSGALPADHTYPAPGGIQVTSPNQITSPRVAPTGQCTSVQPPACGSNFNGSQSQSYQSTITTAYGTAPLPPYSRTVPNDASGGVRGYDICSAGTASTVTAYMEQNLPNYGWTLVSKTGGVETWKGKGGVINWSVSDPLEWNVNWRISLG